ncbi:carboxymuconolactone decarboxylase family protein [Actinocatenispora thailandica]|nr:carboxymuconolactone decarboxylase family protein [Actinocatenispora thailandica]
MTTRTSMTATHPEMYETLRELHRRSEAAGLDPFLIELLKIRCSQINHCAFCIDMHTKDARALGETEQRIYALSAWRETPFFTERERAALALAESVTVLTDGFVPDEVYDAAAAVLEPVEVSAVVWATVVINAFNRLAVTGRTVPGSYVSQRKPLDRATA